METLGPGSTSLLPSWLILPVEEENHGPSRVGPRPGRQNQALWRKKIRPWAAERACGEGEPGHPPRVLDRTGHWAPRDDVRGAVRSLPGPAAPHSLLVLGVGFRLVINSHFHFVFGGFLIQRS